jgi:hypothetical protein
MPSPRFRFAARPASAAILTVAFLLGPPVSAQERPSYRHLHDALGLWPASVTGWRLPLVSGIPPHHHLIFARPASLEIWGRPMRFGYFAGRIVEQPRAQRFAFGEAREDIAWIGEGRQALAQQAVARHAEAWQRETEPRRPEAPWSTPLETEAAREEALLRLGCAAWGERLRKSGKSSTVLAFSRARGEHELLFALGARLARDAGGAAEGPEAAELLGLLTALAHSNQPHEVLRAELDGAMRLGSAGSAARLGAALREGWEALPADETPEIDRERQALAQLDRASARSLRLGARAAARRRCERLVDTGSEPRPVPAAFLLETRAAAAGGLTSAIPGHGIALRFAAGRAQLERGLIGPWGEDVAMDAGPTGDGGFALQGAGALQFNFQTPKAPTSATLVLRHRIEIPKGAANVGVLITIDGNAVLDGSAELPSGSATLEQRTLEQRFDVTEHLHPRYPQWLMLSLAPDAPAGTRYWLTGLELAIEE